MNNIQIDDHIINDYLNGNDLSIYRNDDVFSLGKDPLGNEINIFTEPNPNLIEKAKLITHGFIEEIKKINFSEDPKILKYIPNINELESFITIKLVTGLPHGMRRMFRGGNGDGIVIVIDVINGLLDDDANDLYIEEFANYIRYAVLLMILDASMGTNEENSVETLAHAIFTSSYAEYLSGANQLEKLDEISLVKFWEYTEYQTIKKVLKKKRSSDVTAFMGMVVNSNPEMVVLGVTGKRFLNCIEDENEIFETFQKGHVEFLKSILKNRENKQSILLPNMFTLVNRLLILLVMGYIAWSIGGFLFGESLYNRVFYIYPLIIFITWLFKDLLAYKLEIKTLKRFFVSGIVMAIVSVAYMLIVL